MDPVDQDQSFEDRKESKNRIIWKEREDKTDDQTEKGVSRMSKKPHENPPLRREKAPAPRPTDGGTQEK